MVENSAVVNLKSKYRLCFPFCSDLGNKKLHGADLDSQMNIKWSLFRLRQAPDIVGGGMGLPNSDDGTGNPVKVPGSYFIERIKDEDWGALFKKSEKYEVFIAPNNYPNRGGFFHEDKRALIIDLPNELKEQPHLYKHSTFQFSFLKDIIFSTNLLYMDIDQDNKIRADVNIYASPAGTYFIFQSGQIPFKWKLDVRQGIMTWNLVSDTINSIKSTVAKIIPAIVGGAVGGPAGAVAGSAAGGAMESGGALGGLTQALLTGRDGFKSMGLDRERIIRNQELQTARMFASTSHLTSETTLEPSVFYSNSIKFPYNLYDFALRSFTPQYEARIHISETLYNNLVHNNNQNPTTYPLNITFEKLGYILKPGYWKGELVPDYDPNNRMAECFARGVTFYKDKREYFVNPKLTLASVNSRVVRTGLGADFYTAQAITDQDEPWTNNTDRVKRSNYHQRAHFFIFYEDSSKEHWCVKFPLGFQDTHLADGHTHGGFNLTFSKPVLKMIDVYACIGCGAPGKKGEPAAEELNRDIPGYGFQFDVDYSDGGGLDSLITGIPFDPWFERFTNAQPNGHYIHAGSGLDLGSPSDVWEFTGQYIVGKDNKPFTEAYGFIPSGGTIRWTTKGQGSSKIIWQKQPTNDDFSALDWTPPPGSGGDIEIPLEDPEIALPEPGEDINLPEDDFTPDPLDSTGGEVEIPTIEIDLPPDIEQGLDIDNTPDIDPPPVEIDVPGPDTDQGQDRDTGQDTGDHDPPPDLPEDDPDGD